MTSLRKNEVRNRILHAAIESPGQTGFDRTKMDYIAKRLGLSKGTLYLYFKSKEDLILAICERNLEKARMMRSLQARKTSFPTPSKCTTTSSRGSGGRTR